MKLFYFLRVYMEVSLELHHGDCLEVMKTIPDKSVDLIICDLPYGCLTGGGITKKETAEKYGRKGTEGISGCAWDIKIDLEKFWKEVRRIRRNDHSPCIHFCTTKFGYDLIKSNEKEFRYDLVWDKQRGVSFLSANKMPMRSHEMLYVFAKAGAFYERKDITGDFKNTNKGERPSETHNVYHHFKNTPKINNEGKRCILSVIRQTNILKKGGHPTEKPMELYRFLIERYSPPGGMVLDPTAGSGNSIFTAYDMNRSAIGIEKDDVFYEKMLKRLG
jgi:site-specific DNA-methyltransferase (adenine-specific)